MSSSRVPRDRLPWFPTINYGACRSDLHCLNFCQYEVFDWEGETGRPIVAHPYRCVPGCDACARECEAQAISLPTKKDWLKALSRLRAGTANPASPDSRP